MFQESKEKVLHFYEKYESRLDILFFVGGFAFDALMVSEPDDLFALIQQALYLFLIAILLHHEFLFRMQKWHPRGRWVQLWNYRNAFLHFMLGTLLNIYSLFYIKSSSLLNSLIFLVLMAGFIFANEHPKIKKSKVSFKVALYAICLFSYISVLYPILLGYVSWVPFGLSLVTTLVIFFLQFKFLKRRLMNETTLVSALLIPGVSVLFLFLFFYIMGWIPPVPLSAKEQGVYHLIEKKDGAFLLSTEKEWWKFWQSGDSDFRAEPGDKIYYYVQIYSPARFSDQVFIHWFYKAPRIGWQSSDSIPMKIVGGRKEGFRGFAVKSNYQPGSWRVQVETMTHQEISRLYFEVTAAPENPSRIFTVLSR